jgi:HrpA-like RNA helicase
MENCATLPMRQSAEAFIDAVRAHRVTIVLGATGSGKSTQVPTLLDEAGLAGPGRLIAMTQPRRAAAKCLALRVEEEVQAAARCGMYLSDERGPPAVGCWTRFDRCDPANVNIMYMTEGVLVGKLISERRSAVDLAQRVAMHREKQRKKKGGGGGGGGGDDDQDPATSSSTPLQPKADAMCAVCGIAAKLMCSACKTTPYCTVECQRRGWKKLGHKADCPQINAARLAAERAEEQARAAAEEAEAKRAAEDLADDLVAEWIEQGLARTEERVADTSFASSGGTGWLRRCGVLVIDEAHERSLDTDVILGWIKAVERFRPDLKVVISSATLQSSDFADFFGCTDAAIVSVKGRQYPVAKRFIEPAALGLSPARAEEPLSAFPLDRDTGRRMLPEDDLGPDVVARVVARAVAEVVTSPSCDEEAAGNIVAFLPGADECEDTLSFVRTILEAAGDAVRIADAVEETLEYYDFEDEYALLPLYGSLPLDQQLEATTRKDSRGRRKIIFATNVAETSLTIEGVTVIVDSGLEKVMRVCGAPKW